MNASKAPDGGQFIVTMQIDEQGVDVPVVPTTEGGVAGKRVVVGIYIQPDRIDPHPDSDPLPDTSDDGVTQLPPDRGSGSDPYEVPSSPGGSQGTSGSSGDYSTGDPKPDEAGAYWTERVLADGTQDYMDALLHGDPWAKAALKNPEFMAILQQKMKEENQLTTMISNLIDVQHRSAMASINNMRV